MKSIIAVLVLASVQVTYTQNHENHSASFPPFIIPETELSSCPTQQQRETAVHAFRGMVASNLAILLQCGGGLNWTRVAYLNMSDPMQSCPQNWSDSRSTNGVRVCGLSTDSASNCRSTFYPSGDLSYTKVCGRVIGYQFGHPDGLEGYKQRWYSIDDTYVQGGVSITHGSPRSHIWTLAADWREANNNCLCKGDRSAPAFVGNNYYCESGYNGTDAVSLVLYTSDPLWDGSQCESEGSCCSTAPWFTVDLVNSTSDDIEVRICSGNIEYEDTPIRLLEIYLV